ncbi:ComEC/Rec2 family competence protein [Sphingomonas sp.]|uniref:ComEC/Rec2 family competence protein n=1 Tax=Sphingomonas sp. TaxID=28214 RepID=UPI0025CD7E2D|nr:ComEC/Rec2 family competence protein [Sphingomonas sp.]
MSVAFLIAFRARVEARLDAERAQLPLWFVIAFGAGIAGWLWLPGPHQWSAFIAFALALASAGLTEGRGRLARSLFWGGMALAVGCGLIWWRSDRLAAPRLDRPQVVQIEARVEALEPRAAKGDIRLTLAPAGEALPPRIRVTIPEDVAPPGLGQGATIRVRARLQPPPLMALPGGHDFARDAWFRKIGAVGRSLGPVEVISPSRGGGLDALRDRLGKHIRSRLPGPSGAIATALATGDQSPVGEEDADAMRRSGLAHLLSVSGLHIAAVIGAVMFLALRVLALSERLALRFNLVLVAAGAGALVGIGYTLLTGMQVPTVRSCIAALLVLGGLALGREAISLRLVAVGALVVMIFCPEAIAGASFQLSFAAVTAIIALHKWRPVHDTLAARDEILPARFVRSLAGLLVTGLVVEIALMPFALYHFHRAGLFGVLANMIAVPLTTFIIMPLEGGALLLDSVGAGAPLWAATGWSIDLMLAIAHHVGSAKGAVAMLPTMPIWAFASMVLGGLWLCLWRSRLSRWGMVPIVLGASGAALAPSPDLLVTGDGRHLALVREDGVPLLLRSRSGDFVRDLMSEAAAYDGDPLNLDEQRFARCTRDACLVDILRDGHAWRLLAIRSKDRIDWAQLTQACADADIVVAERRLPRSCKPRWLKLDRAYLERSGGLAIYLGESPNVVSVAEQVRDHPWAGAPIPRRPFATPRARFPTDRRSGTDARLETQRSPGQSPRQP